MKTRLLSVRRRTFERDAGTGCASVQIGPGIVRTLFIDRDGHQEDNVNEDQVRGRVEEVKNAHGKLEADFGKIDLSKEGI